MGGDQATWLIAIRLGQVGEPSDTPLTACPLNCHGLSGALLYAAILRSVRETLHTTAYHSGTRNAAQKVCETPGETMKTDGKDANHRR